MLEQDKLQVETNSAPSTGPSAVCNVVSTNPETAILSNFAHTPFTIDGREFASIEAFVHFVKIPQGAEGRMLKHLKIDLPGLHGSTAYKVGKEINKVLQPRLEAMIDAQENWGSLKHNERVSVRWNNEQFQYGSSEHHALLERAIREKFAQNLDAREALLATGNATLVHETGGSESKLTSLPKEVFVSILTSIRSELQTADTSA